MFPSELMKKTKQLILVQISRLILDWDKLLHFDWLMSPKTPIQPISRLKLE